MMFDLLRNVTTALPDGQSAADDDDNGNVGGYRNSEEEQRRPFLTSRRAFINSHSDRGPLV